MYSSVHESPCSRGIRWSIRNVRGLAAGCMILKIVIALYSRYIWCSAMLMYAVPVWEAALFRVKGWWFQSNWKAPFKPFPLWPPSLWFHIYLSRQGLLWNVCFLLIMRLTLPRVNGRQTIYRIERTWIVGELFFFGQSFCRPCFVSFHVLFDFVDCFHFIFNMTCKFRVWSARIQHIRHVLDKNFVL